MKFLNGICAGCEGAHMKNSNSKPLSAPHIAHEEDIFFAQTARVFILSCTHAGMVSLSIKILTLQTVGF